MRYPPLLIKSRDKIVNKLLEMIILDWNFYCVVVPNIDKQKQIKGSIFNPSSQNHFYIIDSDLQLQLIIVKLSDLKYIVTEKSH